MNKKSIICLTIIIIIIVAVIVSLLIINKKILEKKERTEVLQLIDGKIGIQIYMKTEATDEQMHQLEEDIWKLLGKDKIQSLEFISKQQALETMKNSFEDAEWIFDGYEGENNIFPVSYVITMKITDFKNFSEEYLTNIEIELTNLDNVDKVRMGGLEYVKIYEKDGLEGLKEYIETEKKLIDVK